MPSLKSAVAERDKDALRERIDQLLLVQKGKELSINVEPEVSKYIAELQMQSEDLRSRQVPAVRPRADRPDLTRTSRTKSGTAICTQRVIRQEVGSRITVPRAEFEKYYDEHKTEVHRAKNACSCAKSWSPRKARMPRASLRPRRKRRTLSARAKGEKFPDLAQANSDPHSKAQTTAISGLQKRRARQELSTTSCWTDDAASSPIRSAIATGFLILKVDEKYKEGQAAFEEVEHEIMDELVSAEVPASGSRVSDQASRTRLSSKSSRVMWIPEPRRARTPPGRIPPS